MEQTRCHDYHAGSQPREENHRGLKIFSKFGNLYLIAKEELLHTLHQANHRKTCTKVQLIPSRPMLRMRLNKVISGVIPGLP